MADKSNQGVKFILNAIKGYADIKAERAKIAGDIMANKIKEKDNWFYKMQAEKQKQEMDWQNRQRELDYIKEQFGGGQPAQPQSGAYFGAGVNPIGRGPVDPANSRYSTGGINSNVGQTAQGQPNSNPITANQALENLAARKGFEITGYDPKGRPIIRKIKPPTVMEQKFNLEQADKEKQLQEKSQFVKDSALDSLNTIAEVEKGIGYFGLTGQLPSIPGTARANWEANVNKLLSGKVIDVMTKMKEASKTGATGFGQLSEKELKVLQDASTAFKRGLSPQDAQKYLNEMKIKLQKIAGVEGTQYIQTGTLPDGRKVGKKADGTVELIQPGIGAQYMGGQ